MHTHPPSAHVCTQSAAKRLSAQDAALDQFVAQLEPSWVHTIDELLELAGKSITAAQMQAALVRGGYGLVIGRAPYSVEIRHGWSKTAISAHAYTSPVPGAGTELAVLAQQPGTNWFGRVVEFFLHVHPVLLKMAAAVAFVAGFYLTGGFTGGGK